MRWTLLLTAMLLGCQSAKIAVQNAQQGGPRDAAASQQSPQETPRNAEEVADLPQVTPSKPDSVGTFTFQFENDTFSDKSDNNFTAGFGIAWTSAAVDTLGKGAWFRNIVNDFSFLPTVSNPSYNRHFQLALNMEMYTAQDTSLPDPPPEAHPYSGIIALDSAIYSISDSTMNAYFLRIGLVGPATGAEGLQNGMHTATGRPLAMGWDTQLSNELFVNLFYIHQHRLARWTASEHGFGADFGINGGAGLGTYYIGANAGFQARLGFALPKNFERSYALSLYEEVPGRRMPEGPFTFYIFVQATGIGVGRFLPIDGNTWTSSRSGVRDDWYAQVNLGATMSYGRFVMTFRTNLVGSYFQQQANDDDFSAVTISYVF
jgi:lipid A 3-O-deacylase